MGWQGAGERALHSRFLGAPRYNHAVYPLLGGAIGKLEQSGVSPAPELGGEESAGHAAAGREDIPCRGRQCNSSLRRLR